MFWDDATFTGTAVERKIVTETLCVASISAAETMVSTFSGDTKGVTIEASPVFMADVAADSLATADI